MQYLTSIFNVGTSQETGLSESTDPHSTPDEEEINFEIQDERLCEAYFRNSKSRDDTKKIVDVRKYGDSLNANIRALLEIQQRKNIRRDLDEVLGLKIDEKFFRNNVADILRLMRYEAKNGYKNLSSKNQEKILTCRKAFLADLFGNYDIFFSKRVNKTGYYLPLRKDVTIHTMKCYNPRGFREENNYLKKSPYWSSRKK